jgi:hypothetical protein
MSFFEKQPALSNVYSVIFKDILEQLKEKLTFQLQILS